MSKKELRKEKEQLNSRFKSVCKEWHSINKKLIEGQKEIQKEEMSLRNPTYTQGFEQAFQSGDSRNRTTVYNASLNLIKDYQKNLIKYGKVCHKMHVLEQKIYDKRRQIKDESSYVKGSKTFKQLNYKEGFALRALTNSYKKFYPTQTANVIKTISDIAYDASVDLNLYNEQQMFQELKSLLPEGSQRRQSQIDLANTIESANKSASSKNEKIAEPVARTRSDDVINPVNRS
ncbi:MULTISPECIES: hypothetical protein [unclassified Enterococcus]|uniref:hypothetical protein n=1 Tax=unclassified Enterococcus TaxID=2608891 RepID=UPI00197F2981|nr:MULTISPECIES: hypothetical protein [unclassified Enterococcus]